MKQYTIAILLSILSLTSLAQEVKVQYAHKLYTTQNGLPKIEVTCLFQDERGYIWVGTKSGVARYDGMSFKPFAIKEGLIGNVNNIFQLSSGDIIVYTSRGIYIISDEKVSPLYTDARFAFYMTSSYLIKDKLFIRADIADENLKKDGPGVYLSFDVAKRKFSVLGYERWSKDELCIVSEDKAIVFSSDSTSTQYYYRLISETGLSKKYDLPLKLFFASRRGRPSDLSVIGSDHTVYTARVDGDSLDFQKKFKMETNKSVLGFAFIYSAKDRSIFYIDARNILVRRHPNGISEDIFPVNITHTIMEDNQGNFWLATEDGLYCFFNFKFKEYYWGLKPNKPDLIWSMAQTPDSTFWINSYTEGLWTFKEGATKVKPVYKPGTPEKITALLHHPVTRHDTLFYPGSGQHLIVAGGKPIIKENKPFAHLYFYDDPVTKQILTAGPYIGYLDSNAALNTFASTSSLGLNNTFVLSLARDKYKRLWYTTSKMIGYVDSNKKVTKFNTANMGAVLSVVCDYKGELWFGGNSGLWHYDYRKFTKINNPQLQSIGALYEYKNRSLIISSIGNLSILNLDSFYGGKTIINTYSGNNGFNGIDHSQNSILEDLSGQVWVNTLNTVIRFHPDSLPVNTIYAPIITAVYSSSDNVHWNLADEKYEFLYPNNNLEFSFASITTSHAGDIYYSYRLRGFSNWSLLTKETQVTYTNLPVDNNYVLEVRATLDGINWTTTSTSVLCSITPRWYQTKTFYVLRFALILFVIAGAIFLVLNNRRKTADQRRKLASLQLQAFRNKMLPHLTNNVYTNIIGLIKHNNPELAIEYTYVLSRLNNKLLSLSDEKSQSLGEELKFVEQYLTLQKLIFKERLSYTVDVDESADIHVQVPILVLHTFTENALKHGILNKNEKGTILITAKKKDTGLLLSVADDGVGKKSAALYNKDSSKKGLLILDELIKLFNQYNKNKMWMSVEDITSEDGNSAGTVSKVFIPDNYKF